MTDIGNGHRPLEELTWPGARPAGWFLQPREPAPTEAPAAQGDQGANGDEGSVEEQAPHGDQARHEEQAPHGDQARHEAPSGRALYGEQAPYDEREGQASYDGPRAERAADLWQPAGPEQGDEPNSGEWPAARTGPVPMPGGPPFLTSWARTRQGQSPWEQAHEVWRDCGVSWEETDEPGDFAVVEREGEWPQQQPEWPERDPGWPPQDTGWPVAGGYRVPPDFSAPPAAWAAGGGTNGGAAPSAAWEAADGAGTAAPSAPLGAPTMADAAPELIRDSAPATAYVSHTGDQPDYITHEPDEPWLIRRPAPSSRSHDHDHDRNRSDRKTSPLRMLRIVIPIMLIATVGIGAVMMLTGRTTVALDGHTKTATPKTVTPKTPATRAKAKTSNNMMSMTTFPAPGALPGTTVVQALASQNAQDIATGTAGGLAAIWQRTGSSQQWTLVSRSRSIQGQLTSVSNGDHGWVAVGGSAHRPLVMTSPDGSHWQLVSSEHAFRFGGEHIFGAAGGTAGYIVVGLIMHKGHPVAADWWSTNRTYWQRGGNGGLDGRYAPSQMRAVVATPGGFVAVGQHGNKPSAWMAGTAHDWMLMDLPIPAGATNAILTQTAAHGNQVVALGDATTAHDVIPFAAVSPDGGASWTETPIQAPGAHTTVMTAVTYTSAGFVAAGQMGGKAYYWTSASGTAWSMPKNAGNGILAITGLAANGDEATGVGIMMDRPMVWNVRG
jgi:hypothetical protein